MKILNAVPSKGRPDGLSAKTYAWLCLVNQDVRIFVEPQDYEAYLKVVPSEQLVKMEANDRGLGYAKTQIKAYALKHGYDLIAKLDDDIRSWHVKNALKPAPARSAELWDTAVKDIVKAFEKYPNLAGVSFNYRFELWDPKLWSRVNARLQTVYITRVEDFHADERITFFEDLCNYIKIRADNKMTLRYGLIGINNDVGEAPGGLQAFPRKQEQAIAQLDIIKAEIHPGLEVVKVDKRWGVEPLLKGEFYGNKKL